MPHTIAIVPDGWTSPDGRWESYSDRWITSARAEGHEVRVVDATQQDLVEQIRGCEGLLWRPLHAPSIRLFARRVLPAIEQGLGIPVFPNWRTFWHYDDKVAQHYLLSAAGIPTPQTWVFWNDQKAIDFCSESKYPLVFKLTNGASSENVRLLRSPDEAKAWIDQMFGPGLSTLQEPPKFTLGVLRKRIRPTLKFFLKGTRPDHRPDVQKNYCLIQEFLPNNAFDTRVAVIGDRAFAFRRFNRPNDFRSSGSGLLDLDPNQIDLETVRLAFRVAHVLRTQSIAIDGLRRGDERVVGEMSYTFGGSVALCPGHWELEGRPETGDLRWVEGQLNPADAIMEDFLAQLESRLSSISL